MFEPPDAERVQRLVGENRFVTQRRGDSVQRRRLVRLVELVNVSLDRLTVMLVPAAGDNRRRGQAGFDQLLGGTLGRVFMP